MFCIVEVRNIFLWITRQIPTTNFSIISLCGKAFGYSCLHFMLVFRKIRAGLSFYFWGIKYVLCAEKEYTKTSPGTAGHVDCKRGAATR